MSSRGAESGFFERYRLVPYTDRLAAAMTPADLVVARSGGSVAELTALGKPGDLVPYPYATADHQRKNAREMVAGGAALLVDDAELSGGSRWHASSPSCSATARASPPWRRPARCWAGPADAARRVADQVEDILITRRGRGA